MTYALYNVQTTMSWGTTKSFDVEIRNLSVSAIVQKWKVPIVGPKIHVPILNDLTGIKITAGSFCAILGTSGSGKTTLLNTLAGRSEDLKVDGTILFNDHPVTRAESKKSVGYVMQSDHLLPNLTVRETLRYAGLLRLPTTLSRARKLEMVEELIGELALRDCADRRVGGHGKRGISGGEMRRVSIGVQMLANPGVLFLDEPTSGLDAFTAHNLVSTLLSLARGGKTIIATMHQPRADIFQLFDSVLLLSKGTIAYFGPTQRVLTHFASLGHECPDDVNPPDYLLDLITVDCRTDEIRAESSARLATLLDGFRSSAVHADNMVANASPSGPNGRKEGAFSIESHNTSGFTQTWLLYHRALLNMMRDKTVVAARILETLLIGLIIGGIFYQLPGDASGIKSRISAFYIVIILQPYLIIIANILQYSEELLVFDREHYDGMYHALPYWLAAKASSLPFEVVTAFLFSVIFYWMANMRHSFEHFMWFFLIMMLAQYCSACLGFMAASIIRQFAGASLMANLLMTFWGLTTGLLINPATFPIYMNWIGYTSMYQYAYGGLAGNELKDNHYDCPYPPDDVRCSLYNGNDILARLELKTTSVSNNAIILVGVATIFNIISLLALRFIQHRPK
eukprot:gene12624-14819_t